MAIDHIYTDGRHYDSMFTGNPDAIPFWIKQAHTYGEPILELACGTGRLTIPMAQAGFDVTGIDLSEAMLAVAEQKADDTGTMVDFMLGDIRHFNLDRKFSFIFLPANALCHLLTLDDFEACMAAVRHHMSADSVFMVEVFVPDLSLLSTEPENKNRFATYEDPDERGEVTIMYTYRYDQATQIKHNTTYHMRSDSEEEIVGTLPMRIFFPIELDALFKYNGFNMIHKYGDMHLSPFTSHSPTQIFALSLSPQT